MSTTTDADGGNRSARESASATSADVPGQAFARDDTEPGVPRQASVLGGWLGAGRAARRAHRVAVTREAASVLLGYPDQVFFERLPMVVRAVAELPRGTVRTALQEFCEHVSTTSAQELCERYVDVFDLYRCRSLYMTYYSDGDTRRRGRVLAEVKRAYTEAGWRAESGELPDHLTVLLEFAARGDTRAGEELLVWFRSGIELLGRALHDHGTPYARVVDAVRLALPAQSAADRERARRLAAQGPPSEGVGLEAYGARTPLPLTDVNERGGEPR